MMIINLINKDTVTSTNTVLKEMAESGAAEGTVVAAKMQTAGKGRLGRSFFSPDSGSIYMSILVRPRFDPDKATLLTTAAAVAVAFAVEEVTGKEAGIKWVNDIYFNDKKVCGILTEGQINPESGALEYAIVGIGINLYDPEGGFPAELPNAGSVFGRVNADDAIRQRVIDKVLEVFDRYYAQLPFPAFLSEYKNRSFLIGKRVLVHKNIKLHPEKDNEAIPAIVLDVDEKLRLVVRYDDGKTEGLSTGEVSVVIADNM